MFATEISTGSRLNWVLAFFLLDFDPEVKIFLRDFLEFSAEVG